MSVSLSHIENNKILCGFDQLMKKFVLQGSSIFEPKKMSQTKTQSTLQTTVEIPSSVFASFQDIDDEVVKQYVQKLFGDPKTNWNQIIKYTYHNDEHDLSSPCLNAKRRRAFAYIWVKGQNSKTDSYVFYGGSVFNPTKNNTNNSFYLPYNKKNERQTAAERLKKTPVIFKTCATTAEQVIHEIVRMAFRVGVKSKTFRMRPQTNTATVNTANNNPNPTPVQNDDNYNTTTTNPNPVQNDDNYNTTTTNPNPVQNDDNYSTTTNNNNITNILDEKSAVPPLSSVPPSVPPPPPAATTSNQPTQPSTPIPKRRSNRSDRFDQLKHCNSLPG